MERVNDMSRQKLSPQALKICGLTLLCMIIMFGVAAANKARGGESLVHEYTVSDALPRHVKFEQMPSQDAQLPAAWFFKYMGLGQFDMCHRVFPEDQLEVLNLQQSDLDFKDGIYIEEYIIHSFETLTEDAYADSRERYDALSAGYGYEEYQVIRVRFSQKWSTKALETAPQWGDGTYTRDFAVGKEAGFRGK